MNISLGLYIGGTMCMHIYRKDMMYKILVRGLGAAALKFPSTDRQNIRQSSSPIEIWQWISHIATHYHTHGKPVSFRMPLS